MWGIFLPLQKTFRIILQIYFFLEAGRIFRLMFCAKLVLDGFF